MTTKYIGNELDLFKNACNWKLYFSSKIKKHIIGDVLEVGSGIGANTEYLIKNNNKISSITCLEPDELLCANIKTTHSIGNVKATEIINGTIKLIDQKYDTIIYIDVLEHIEKSKLEVEYIYERLKKNGKLIILVPAYNFLFSEFDKNIGHYRRYNKKLLRKDINKLLLEKNVFYLDSMGFFASLVNKLILKKSNPSESNIIFWDKILIKISKLTDKLFFHLFGKSLVGIYQKK